MSFVQFSLGFFMFSAGLCIFVAAIALALFLWREFR